MAVKCDRLVAEEEECSEEFLECDVLMLFQAKKPMSECFVQVRLHARRAQQDERFSTSGDGSCRTVQSRADSSLSSVSYSIYLSRLVLLSLITPGLVPRAPDLNKALTHSRSLEPPAITLLVHYMARS